MDVLIALGIFIAILLVVVLVHEAGHFVAARMMGVKVEEFGFGFPPKLYGYRPEGSETEYTVNALPLGGFVRLYGEDGSYADDPRSFAAKSYRAKVFIVGAGVGMNLLLALAVFGIMGLLGAPVSVDEDTDAGEVTNVRVLIADVASDSPAQEAGLERGSEIVSINGTSVASAADIKRLISQAQGDSIELMFRSGGETDTAELTPREDPPEGEGAIGIVMREMGLKRLGVLEAAEQAVMRVVGIIVGTAVVLGKLVASIFVDVGGNVQGQVAGPVGIFAVVQQMYQQGFSYVLLITGALSTSLAFINILPIPALDGGRWAFLTVERIRGKELPEGVTEQIHGAGLLLLLGLIIVVTIKDIMELL